jgi:hypothetical protein
LFHIAKVEVDFNSRPYAVKLTVDTKARDLLTIAAIMQRNRNTEDPANRSTQIQRRQSKIINDTQVIWDCENGAGRVPKTALFGGLWTILKIPAGSFGQIAQINMHTFGPATPFAFAVFDKGPGAHDHPAGTTPGPTAKDMAALIGDPSVQQSGANPWDVAGPVLDDMGYLYAAGGPDGMCGYWPYQQSSTASGGDQPGVSGQYWDKSGFTYDSTMPPWLWIAVWAKDSCYIKGRFFQGVSGS